MNKEYITQLEETVQQLSKKLDECVRDNEGLSKRCDWLDRYQPTIHPFIRGYILCINKAVIARLQEEKNGDGRLVGYVLWIGDSRVCAVSNVDDGRRIIQEWLDTGYNGIPVGG